MAQVQFSVDSDAYVPCSKFWCRSVSSRLPVVLMMGYESSITLTDSRPHQRSGDLVVSGCLSHNILGAASSVAPCPQKS